MIKITKTVLPDNSICYTAIFKNKYEQQKIKSYLDSINARIICTTYLEHYGYYDYYLEGDI